MKKLLQFLSLKNILLIIASLLSMIMIIIQLIHYIDGTLTWGIFFLCLGIIYISFLIAHMFPKLPIVILLREIHQSNLEDIKDQELKEAE
tara:strand:+ start:36 stop:305 length:270 start_codon:yes stop_codon:yes gene_type:complete